MGKENVIYKEKLKPFIIQNHGPKLITYLLGGTPSPAFLTLHLVSLWSKSRNQNQRNAWKEKEQSRHNTHPSLCVCVCASVCVCSGVFVLCCVSVCCSVYAETRG